MENIYNNPNVKQFVTELKNPTYSQTHMKKEKHVAVVGGTGTGKTSALANYIRSSPSEFAHIVVCYRNIDEPIYQALDESLGKKGQITFFNLDSLPDCLELSSKKTNPEDHYLIVFDDIIADLHANRKHKAKVENYFLTSRKLHFTCWFLSQSYFQIPKTVRLQLSYVLLLKVNSTADLRMVLRDYALGVDLTQLQMIYNIATAQPMNFLKIDVASAEPTGKFERNFTDSFYATPYMKRDGSTAWNVEPGPWFLRTAPPRNNSKRIHYF